MKACRLAAEKSAIGASRTRPGRWPCTSTAPATSILPWPLRPRPPSGGSSLLRCGISVSSISTRPFSGGRSGATMARRSLAQSSHAVLYEPSPGPEPGDERHLRAVHHRAGGHRGLLAATGAFPGEGLRRQFPSLITIAGRTPEAVRPAGIRQIRRTGALVGEAVLELQQRSRKVEHDGCSRGVRSLFYAVKARLSPHLACPERKG